MKGTPSRIYNTCHVTLSLFLAIQVGVYLSTPSKVLRSSYFLSYFSSFAVIPRIGTSAHTYFHTIIFVLSLSHIPLY